MKNIEVEIRGSLTKNQYDELIEKFNHEGKFIKEKNRMLLCYDDPVKKGNENKSTDIRLRATNGSPEIIVKLGKWGATENRKEISVPIKKGDFDKMVEIFGVIGLTKGVLCERKGRIFEYDGVEFSLVEVPNHSYYFEAEKMISKAEDSMQTQEEIKKVCLGLGLKIFNDKEFYSYIDQLDREANKEFGFKNYKEGFFLDNYDV